MLVMGGSDGSAIQNDHEAWIPNLLPPSGFFQPAVGGGNLLVPGPTVAANILGTYPRAHYLSNDFIAFGGHGGGGGPGSDRINHYSSNTNPLWRNLDDWRMQPPFGDRFYNSSVLAPISAGGVLKDYIVSIGGMYSTASPQYILADAFDVCLATGNPPTTGMWQPLPLPLPGGYAPTSKRWCHNTVLLPDSTIFVVGGQTESLVPGGCVTAAAFTPEVYSPTFGIWQPMAAMDIIRDYHSTALLLPSGHVLTGGGESRHKYNATSTNPCVQANRPGAADYQIWTPHYLNCGQPQPVIPVGGGNAPAHGSAFAYDYGSTHTIYHNPLPQGYIDKVVLMRAGSVTHHSDTNQRCVELNFSAFAGTPQTNPGVNVTVPPKSPCLLPRGYYMLFLVTNQGVPSMVSGNPQYRGFWVQVQ